MSARVRAWCRCGWHGEYRSQRQADYARRQHKCERFEAKRAAAVRGIQRDKAIDRTPKPCLHKIAQHQHGTYVCYTADRCRCLPCATAASEYERKRERDAAYGRQRLVDAEPVRQHVRDLAAAGIGLKTLTRLSGVTHGSLWKLMYGRTRPDGTRTPSARVRAEIAAKILAVHPSLDALADGAKIDATGTVRRVQALMVLGWSVPQVAARADVDRQVLDAVMLGHRTLITAARAHAVRTAYEQLWNQAPPQGTWHEKGAAARARNKAAAAGWAPPLAWDDDTIDDPATTPQLGELEPIKGGVSATSRLDDWLHLVTTGEHPDRAARRVGYAAADGWKQVRTIAARIGHTAVLDWLDLWLANRPDITGALADEAAARYKTRRSTAA